MAKKTGTKLLESFLDGCLRAIPEPVTTEGRIRLPVPSYANPRRDVPIPEAMTHLPVDERGYRVPYFVSWIDGKPDFRIVRPDAVRECIQKGLCWICGQPHARKPDGSYTQTFAVGPMCAINRVSAEPGSHLACARYAVQVCPFLIAPGMRRNEKEMPAHACDPGGLFIKRNPGVSALWTTARWKFIKSGQSLLFRLGDPTALEFWREGRHATHAEVLESIRTGLPILEAEAAEQGPEAVGVLADMTMVALDLIWRYA